MLNPLEMETSIFFYQFPMHGHLDFHPKLHMGQKWAQRAYCFGWKLSRNQAQEYGCKIIILYSVEHQRHPSIVVYTFLILP